MGRVFEGLPLYYMDINGTDTGVQVMSLVESPAVETMFLKFADDKKPIRLSADDERHIVSGVAMIPELPIYRRDEDGKEYYITFTAAAIERIVEKFFADGNATSINLNHAEPNTECVIFESYLLNHKRGIVPVEFADYPNGTWIISAKVNDEALWSDIKAGKYNGFSIEGILDAQRTAIQEFSKINKMSKISKFMKALLAKVSAQLGKVDTDKGALYWDNDQILRVGDEVWALVVGDDGAEDYEKPADGKYIAEDGRVITVEDGKVIEIAEGEAKEVKADGDPTEKDPADPANDDSKADEATAKALADLSAKMDAFANDMQALRDEVAELKGRIDKIENAPADDPADDGKKNDVKAERLAALAAIRKKKA